MGLPMVKSMVILLMHKSEPMKESLSGVKLETRKANN